MALKTYVKISNVNNLSDARYCAGMYTNIMGFALEETNPDYLTPDKFREITEWLSGLEYVGEFETAHPDSILKILEEYPAINHIQIQERTHLQMLVNTSYNIILKQYLNEAKDLEELISIADGLKENDVVLLLESGNLLLEDTVRAKIKELAGKVNLLLGFGITADNVENLVNELGVKGIALRGGKEIKPGFKDFDELADILEALEIED